MGILSVNQVANFSLSHSNCEQELFPDGQLPPQTLTYEEFIKKFNLAETTTEQLQPQTLQLSQTLHQDIQQGLELLLAVDRNVVDGLEMFLPYIDQQAPIISEKLTLGGRIFLIGSGSSGRVGLDLAAKTNPLISPNSNQIIGVIAGGDSALIRAKEGFEDSEEDGKNALKKVQLTALDTVILISASGSASFNVGCGQYASQQGAHILYFYNSINIPERTQGLFDLKENPVIPLCIDIGQQAIAGSTRLQGATLAEVALGALFAKAISLMQKSSEITTDYPEQLVEKLQICNQLIKEQFDQIADFILQEQAIFSDPRSNFRQVIDTTNQGYVTFLASADCMREVLVDATETSPTFSTNPIRRENEVQEKRAEFRAYLLGDHSNNLKAWEAVLGRAISAEDQKDVENFILNYQTKGVNSYLNRPKGEGNLLIGVAKLNSDQKNISSELLEQLQEIQNQKGGYKLIVISESSLSEEQKEILQPFKKHLLLIENIPQDSLGLCNTIVLKQTLNLISNGSMIMMNKILGNRMIDLRTSNKKLIDRCIRLVKSICSEFQVPLPSDRTLYYDVIYIHSVKRQLQEQGIYTPSIIKFIIAMLAMSKTPHDFEAIIAKLREQQEDLSWIDPRGRFKY